VALVAVLGLDPEQLGADTGQQGAPRCGMSRKSTIESRILVP
jgi:hypothetical protein